MAVQYFKVKPERQEWKGNRFFRFDINDEKLVHVCLHAGKMESKGRAHTVGIYMIKRETFLINWFKSYVDECTKEDYDKAFAEAIQTLTK